MNHGFQKLVQWRVKFLANGGLKLSFFKRVKQAKVQTIKGYNLERLIFQRSQIFKFSFRRRILFYLNTTKLRDLINFKERNMN